MNTRNSSAKINQIIVKLAKREELSESAIKSIKKEDISVRITFT